MINFDSIRTTVVFIDDDNEPVFAKTYMIDDKSVNDYVDSKIKQIKRLYNGHRVTIITDSPYYKWSNGNDLQKNTTE